MKLKFIEIFFTLTFFLSISGISTKARGHIGIEGIWKGAATVFDNTNLPIFFRFNFSPDSTLKAFLEIPSLGTSASLAIDSFSRGSVSVHVRDSLFPLRLYGELSQDESELNCQLKIGKGKLTRQKLTRVTRPQEPILATSYETIEVEFDNHSLEAKLVGTLTLPRSKSTSPALILISGTGPDNRNSEHNFHKPFWIIADFLSRRGVAVLRFDDRGTGQSTGDFKTATINDFAGDVVGAVNYLKSRSDIDASRIGLFGHSEGGLVAPIAANMTEVGFVILYGAPGVSFEQIRYEQFKAKHKIINVPDFLIESYLKIEKRLIAIVKDAKDSLNLIKFLEHNIDSILSELPDSIEYSLQISKESLKVQAHSMISPRVRMLLTYDPIPSLQNVKCPLLLIYGNKDVQVPAYQSTPIVEKALKESGNLDFTIAIHPELNHMFQIANTGSILEYAFIEQTVAPELLEIIAEWIEKHVR